MFWNGMMLLSTLLARTASVRQRTGAYGMDFFISTGSLLSRNNPFHMGALTDLEPGILGYL